MSTTPPATPRRPASATYHGVTVTEQYRWLEDWGDPQVRGWAAAQSAYARAALDAAPGRAALRERLGALYMAAAADFSAIRPLRGGLLALRHQPPSPQPALVLLSSPDDPAGARVVLDPAQLDPSGATTIDFFAPSPDGRLVAVSLSQGGSEDGTLHLFEVDTGRELGDRIPRVTYPTAGGSVAWDADSAGLAYTRYPRGAERPPEDHTFYQQVYHHRLGDPIERDAYLIGADFPRIAEIELLASPDGRHLLATVGHGDGGEYEHALRGPDGAWSRLTRAADQVTHAAFSPDGALYLLSHAGAPRGAILRLPLDTPDLAHATLLVPEGDAAIVQITPAATCLYVTEVDGGPSQVRVYDLQGRALGLLPLPPVVSVLDLAHLGDDEALLRVGSYTAPPTWLRFRPAQEDLEPTALAPAPPADFSDVEVVREHATSPDGARVPLSIIRLRGAPLDGARPTLLYGYGGFGISLVPSFNPSVRAWLDAGGVFAIANLRGGGEYGAGWHHAGRLTHKQRVFDDFLACAEHLIAAGYTTPARLAIMGRSNGGLLVGAALTQRPDLFRAAVAGVGVFDMLRVELDPNGAFNTTEFGSVADPDQFRALYAYSPYHRVADGVAYPATLLLTGDNDGRVNPAHSRKMAARLQAATTSGLPVLLRTSASSGHGIGTALAERVDEWVDIYAFLLDQLGVRPAAGGR